MVSLTPQGAGLGVESASPRQLALPSLPSPLVLSQPSSLIELQSQPLPLSFASSSEALPAMDLGQAPPLSAWVAVA